MIRMTPPCRSIPWMMPLLWGSALLAISACSVQAPSPVSEQSAAIGISVEHRWVGGLGINEYPDKAYFIRLKNGDKLLEEDELYHSNFHVGKRVYLLNAKPGRYVAVATSEAVGKTGTRRAFNPLGELDEYKIYSAYFNEEIIRKTAVDVKPGDFAVMGDLAVELDHEIRLGDKIQKYFHLVVDQTLVDPFGNPLIDPDNSVATRARLLEDWSGKASEQAFLEKALVDLEIAGWTTQIQRRLEQVRSP